MSKRKILLFVFGFLLVFTGVILLRDCFTVDKCLDNGGRWDYQTSKYEK
jgi:hypothetical protein